MERTAVTKEELLDILKNELDKLDEDGDYKDCRFDGIFKLDESDENGCNWSTGFTISNCSNECKSDARRVVLETSKKYNLG